LTPADIEWFSKNLTVVKRAASQAVFLFNAFACPPTRAPGSNLLTENRKSGSTASLETCTLEVEHSF
jgi:hypothetical protein